MSVDKAAIAPGQNEDADEGAAGEDESKLVECILVKHVRETWTKAFFRSGAYLNRLYLTWVLRSYVRPFELSLFCSSVETKF